MAVKKKRRRVKKSVKIVAAVFVSIISITIFITVYYHNRWYPNTVINGINVSGLTYKQSVKEFQNAIDNYKLDIVGDNNQTLTINGKDIDLSVVYQVSLDKDFKKHMEKRGFFRIFKGYHHNIDLNITYNQESLNTLINNSVLVIGDESYPINIGTNAHIEYNEESKVGEIIKGTDGNQLNVENFSQFIYNTINTLKTSQNISDHLQYRDLYQKGSANMSDKQLEKALSVYNSYLLNWFTWDMGEGVVETLTPSDIKAWLSCNDEGEIVLNKDGLSEWIEAFCLKYKTVGKARNFTTHAGNVIQVSGGDYGWRLDYEEIVEQVYESIVGEHNLDDVEAYIKDPSKKNIKKLTTSLEPVYSNKGYKKDYVNFVDDWDDQNYSEIDLTEQRVYVYRGGQLAYTCICITGKPTEEDRITRTGVWYIKEKKLEKILVGEDYRTPSKYWVRIMWTGTGYHFLQRSDWASWSPTLYETKGSHGCINLQLEDAKAIYELVSINDPVFIHK